MSRPSVDLLAEPSPLENATVKGAKLHRLGLQRSRQRAGFTLVEVLISITLLVVIMTILWSSFSTSFRIRDMASEKYERLRTVQAALRRMQREISMAFVTRIGEEPTNERGRVTYQTAFIGRSDRLDFTNFAHLRTRVDEVASEQSEISYFLRSDRGADGRMQNNLVRRQQAPIDDDMQSGGIIYTLLEDVHSITFEYWRPDFQIAGDAWERQWDTTDNYVEGLPPRVRITLVIPDPVRPRERMEISVQTVVHLTQPIGYPLQTSTADVRESLELIRQGGNAPRQPTLEELQRQRRP